MPKRLGQRALNERNPPTAGTVPIALTARASQEVFAGSISISISSSYSLAVCINISITENNSNRRANLAT